jgi:hypothetical protein
MRKQRGGMHHFSDEPARQMEGILERRNRGLFPFPQLVTVKFRIMVKWLEQIQA